MLRPVSHSSVQAVIQPTQLKTSQRLAVLELIAGRPLVRKKNAVFTEDNLDFDSFQIICLCLCLFCVSTKH